jgi:PKD repeat protein
MYDEGGPLQISLDVTPAPDVYFSFNSWDPSVFDVIQFYDSSWDPGGVGIASCAWDFDDSITATGCYLTHQYAADGSYTVQETVTTHDGRTGQASREVVVHTHDVAITRFSAPQAR